MRERHTERQRERKEISTSFELVMMIILQKKWRYLDFWSLKITVIYPLQLSYKSISNKILKLFSVHPLHLMIFALSVFFILLTFFLFLSLSLSLLSLSLSFYLSIYRHVSVCSAEFASELRFFWCLSYINFYNRELKKAKLVSTLECFNSKYIILWLLKINFNLKRLKEVLKSQPLAIAQNNSLLVPHFCDLSPDNDYEIHKSQHDPVVDSYMFHISFFYQRPMFYFV